MKTLVIFTLSLLSASYALKCHVCSDFIRKPSQCDSRNKEIVQSDQPGAACRIYTKGGKVVGSSIVSTPALCEPAALVQNRGTIQHNYAGIGEPDSFCCDHRDFCQERSRSSNNGNQLPREPREPQNQNGDTSEKAPLNEEDASADLNALPAQGRSGSSTTFPTLVLIFIAAVL